MTQRRMSMFGLLLAMSLVGTALAVHGVTLIVKHDHSLHLSVFVELGCIGLILLPWSVRLPSGASWRPGVPLMMMSIFLLKPAYVVVVPIAGLIVLTAKARAPWWKYFETIAHVGIGLYIGAQTYDALLSLLPSGPLAMTLALLPALFVHLLVNRLISALIVANREQRSLGEQVRLTFKELHWGYLNAYFLIVVASLLDHQTMELGILAITILQVGIFKSVGHYSRMEQIKQSTWKDGLTNVENRASWELFCESVRTGISEGQIGVIDVNDFKDINDKHGHLVGDEVLRQIADTLQAVLPRGARIFRVGGDEFVVFVRDAQRVDLVGAVEKGMAVRRSEQPAHLGNLFVSVGQAVCPDDGRTVTELFVMADRRMYEAKRSVRYTESGIDFGIPASVLSLILAIESRDTYTSGHNLRVAYYAWQLALQMDVDMATLKTIFRAGLVHDVGKIGIPDAILNKQGKLTAEEYRVVQQHPVTGYEMCVKLGFANSELDAIRYHHERWDGNGYPSGLSGLQTPLVARILAVADVYDALTSSRVYRDAWTHDAAMDYLVDQRGRQFDPTCVDQWVDVNRARPQREKFLAWVQDTSLKDALRDMTLPARS